jgi:hypothetical protein
MQLPDWVANNIPLSIFALLVLAWTSPIVKADGMRKVDACIADCSTGARCAKFASIVCGKHVTCRERNERERNHCVAVCKQHCATAP